MAKKLEEYYDSLLEIRTYLVKIGPRRRQGSICSKKYNEANIILQSFDTELLVIGSNLGKFSETELSLINKFTDQIKRLFEEIKFLCSSTKVIDNMESFSLKTAVALLPIMNDTENVTKQLISAIELYSSLLNDESKPILINFILKTRLSENAKLRLNQNYGTVQLLVDDMKKYLISKKSFTALQEQLMRCRQDQRDIEDYGKEIEHLFVNLTISQADGDTTKYDVLKPLNEKMAIKRFATGLQNKHISTIISAKNYDSLKDAIRDAADEQTSMSPRDSIMKLTNRQYSRNNVSYSSRGRCFQARGTYNNHRGQFWSRGGGQPARARAQPRGRYYTSYRGNRGSQGMYIHRNNAHSNRGRNYVTSISVRDTQNNSTSNNTTTEYDTNQFFRE